jgi:hypothetical protein
MIGKPAITVDRPGAFAQLDQAIDQRRAANCVKGGEEQAERRISAIKSRQPAASAARKISKCQIVGDRIGRNGALADSSHDASLPVCLPRRQDATNRCLARKPLDISA